MCFVNLQKAFDFVDRELQWQVLTGVDAPAKVLEVIRQFRAGMRLVYVRLTASTLTGLMSRRGYD